VTTTGHKNRLDNYRAMKHFKSNSLQYSSPSAPNISTGEFSDSSAWTNTDNYYSLTAIHAHCTHKCIAYIEKGKVYRPSVVLESTSIRLAPSVEEKVYMRKCHYIHPTPIDIA